MPNCTIMQAEVSNMDLGFVAVSGDLAPWGQAAAFVLALYLFFSTIVGLVLAAVLMFALAWIRSKAELIKNLRPNLNELNQALIAGQKGDPLPEEMANKRLVQMMAQVPRAAAQMPATASSIEQKVERGTDRVAEVVIELRARTEMVKGMARAFFLPGLVRRTQRVPPIEQVIVEREPAMATPESEVVREHPLYEEEITISQSSRS